MMRVCLAVGREIVHIAHAQGKQRAHGGAHHARVKHVRRRAHQRHVPQAKAQAGPQNGAQVPHIRRPVQHHMRGVGSKLVGKFVKHDGREAVFLPAQPRQRMVRRFHANAQRFAPRAQRRHAPRCPPRRNAPAAAARRRGAPAKAHGWEKCRAHRRKANHDDTAQAWARESLRRHCSRFASPPQGRRENAVENGIFLFPFA